MAFEQIRLNATNQRMTNVQIFLMVPSHDNWKREHRISNALYQMSKICSEKNRCLAFPSNRNVIMTIAITHVVKHRR